MAVNIIGDDVNDDNKKTDGQNQRVNDVINQHLPDGVVYDEEEGKKEDVDPVVLGAINK